MKVFAVVLFGGRGTRFKSAQPKQFERVQGKMILSYTLESLEKPGLIDHFILVSRPEDFEILEKEAKRVNLPSYELIEGGEQRCHSVFNGLLSISPKDGIVLIHDGARPYPSASLIQGLIRNVRKHSEGCIPFLPMTDTVKTHLDGKVRGTVKREDLIRVQTPQAFQVKKIMDAYRDGLQGGFHGSDDSSFYERSGGTVYFIESNPENIKITYPQDLRLFEFLVRDSNSFES